MKEIFIDTSALLSILNQDDQDYEASLRIWSSLADESARLVTSNVNPSKTASVRTM